MGIVYLARDVRLGRQIALKVIAPHLAPDPAFRERFAAEARSAAAIEHPNAVTVYSAGSADGHLFIAMRYIEGTDLRRALAESGPLAPRAAARLTVEVAGALDAAHAAGFVHRDVKPANILLTGAPGSGTAYLTDFGLTRGLGSSQVQLTETGQWMGTLDYVAPEQVTGERLDARTDIYSLGTVLYEMLAGAVPFSGDEMQKLWRKTNEDPPPLPPNAPGRAFDPVLARAIARDPEPRFRSAGDLGRAASAAAGEDAGAPTERSVATGPAAAGLEEVDVRLRGRRPAAPAHTARLPRVRRPAPARRQITPAPVPAPAAPAGDRRSGARAAAIIVCALAIAAGLVTGALVLARGKGGKSRTVITRRAAAPRRERTTAAAAVTTTSSAPEEEGQDEESTATDVAVEPLHFEGSEYSATLPAGWEQQESEKRASDGSYIENTWTSPDGGEELLIDESPAKPADPARSMAKIGGYVREEGETVYAEESEVERGGMLGSELDFHADSKPAERVDFFFDIGDDGFAVLASAGSLGAAQALVDPLVSSIQMKYPAAP
jgi:serine/threonine-protein kinase